MRSIIRLVAASALSVPLVIGAAGIASADVEFDQSDVAANANGAVVYDQAAGADDYGNSYYYEQAQLASPYGAGSYLVVSWVYDGHAGYYDHYSWSGPEGAYAGDTSATADAPDYSDDYDDDSDYED
ncbi:hypothetical protein B0I31_107135 [Saccharothrix carnea]|uniref:Secreted protein n=1 Tax=Saccharothrix carnea TaxID=1280637 RepID=A0A2P8I6I4_SACCR|nr:hypothetical protein [Saccharothrix carnea]PSL54081.1 hypothetical protein B0I31_107135 [Saccharothrix carnea]